MTICESSHPKMIGKVHNSRALVTQCCNVPVELLALLLLRTILYCSIKLSLHSLHLVIQYRIPKTTTGYFNFISYKVIRKQNKSIVIQHHVVFNLHKIAINADMQQVLEL